jgi:hypothetical protein
MRNKISPALIGALGSTGPSMTWPATSGTICTELRTTTAEPRGAPHPMGMNKPTRRSSKTMTSDTFQNRLNGTIVDFIRTKRIIE